MPRVIRERAHRREVGHDLRIEQTDDFQSLRHRLWLPAAR
jgi:hypothetical protein